MMVALVQHDPGCNPATRQEVGGAHTDDAKRFCDWYNLHREAGAPIGHWIAVKLADGDSDGCAYPDRSSAVSHQHHNEKWYCFIQLRPCTMTVCEAESLLRWQRHANRLQKGFTDRDAKQGGLQVIPRLTMEDQEQQIAALDGHIPGAAIALGYAKEGSS
jgi:hypothetical protein